MPGIRLSESPWLSYIYSNSKSISVSRIPERFTEYKSSYPNRMKIKLILAENSTRLIYPTEKQTQQIRTGAGSDLLGLSVCLFV